MMTIGLKLGFVAGVVALAVQALQRRDNARRRPPPPPSWPPLDVDGEQRSPASTPATEEFSLSATGEEVAEAARATEHEAAELQQRLATAPIEGAIHTETAPAGATWVDPDDGACPSSHPVKVKLRSRVFHLPGMVHYDRTNADRCYRDGAAAEGDGFRQAKR